MKKLVIRESGGQYHLENFGSYYTGLDGRQRFHLVIESEDGRLSLEFPEATVFDIFARFNLRDQDFMEGRFACPNFVRITDQGGECVVEAPCGTLYDFFKERAASGHCRLSAYKPLSFYWRGRGERDAA
jgi:hypothetical protein